MNKLLKLSVLSISLLIIMAGSSVSPALSEIGRSFPYTKPNLLKMIVTLPSLVLIPFSLISGRMAQMVKKRKILIVGLILYAIGGIGGGFSKGIYGLLLFRFILGIGMGLLLPLSTSLIADFFVGDERTHMMGLSNAFANLGAIISTLSAGWLASINWRYVFGVYLISIPVLLIIIIGLPEPPKRIIFRKSRYYINFSVIVLSILAFLLNVAFYSVVTNISLFIEARNLGNSEIAGLSVSFLTFAGFVSGIFLRNITKYLGKILVPFSIGTMGLGFILLGTTYVIKIIYLSTFLIGLGLGILKPIILIKVADVTPRLSNSFALSLVNSSMFLGKFMSPFILDFLGIIFKNREIGFTFTLMGILILGSAILSLSFSMDRIKAKE